MGVWLVATALFHLYTATVGILQPRLQRGTHLLLLLPMVFLLYPATKKSPRDRFTVVDVILAVLSVLPSLYLIVYNDSLNMRFERVDPFDDHSDSSWDHRHSFAFGIYKTCSCSSNGDIIGLNDGICLYRTLPTWDFLQ